MKKALFPLVALVLALGLALMPVAPASAAEIAGSKNVDPPTPNEYRVGDTIHYVMSVTNPSLTLSMTVDIWDILPDGTTKVDLADDITILPGGTENYTLDYVVDADDIQIVGEDKEVINTLYAEGKDENNDDVDLRVEKISFIITEPPLVGGDVRPINKVAVLAPWLGLALLLIGGVSWLTLRRRRA